MRILPDTCVWDKAREVLADQGHDVEWAGHWDEDPGDPEILEMCHSTAARPRGRLEKGAIITVEANRVRIWPRD